MSIQRKAWGSRSLRPWRSRFWILLPCGYRWKHAAGIWPSARRAQIPPLPRLAGWSGHYARNAVVAGQHWLLRSRRKSAELTDAVSAIRFTYWSANRSGKNSEHLLVKTVGIQYFQNRTHRLHQCWQVYDHEPFDQQEPKGGRRAFADARRRPRTSTLSGQLTLLWRTQLVSFRIYRQSWCQALNPHWKRVKMSICWSMLLTLRPTPCEEHEKDCPRHHERVGHVDTPRLTLYNKSDKAENFTRPDSCSFAARVVGISRLQTIAEPLQQVLLSGYLLLFLPLPSR